MHLGTGRQIHPDRYLDFFNVFDEVLQAAIDERVDALLIAGDLFDTKEPDVETLSRTIALLKRLKDTHPTIEVLAIEGNHDIRKRAIGVYRNQQGALDVLASAGLLRVLRPERESGDDGDDLDWEAATFHAPHHDVSILGLGYQREHPENRFNDALPYIENELSDRQVIMLQHMMLAPEGMVYHGATHPSSLHQAPSNLKYVGLGHGHSRIVPGHAFHQELFCAPGSLEFIHVRNVGKDPASRGYFLVEMRGKSPTIEHRETTRKRLFLRKNITLDPTQDTSFDGLRERIGATFETGITAGKEAPILSLRLDGRLGFAAADFRSSVIQRDLRERFGALQVLVDRQDVETLTGEQIQLDAADDYTDALQSALEDLLAQSALELGFEEPDPIVLSSLQHAIAEPQTTDEALATIQARFKARRTSPPLNEQELNITDLSLTAIEEAIAQLVAREPSGQLIRLILTGQAPLDEDGLPAALPLERLVEAVPENVILIPSSKLYSVELPGGQP